MRALSFQARRILAGGRGVAVKFREFALPVAALLTRGISRISYISAVFQPSKGILKSLDYIPSFDSNKCQTKHELVSHVRRVFTRGRRIPHPRRTSRRLLPGRPTPATLYAAEPPPTISAHPLRGVRGGGPPLAAMRRARLHPDCIHIRPILTQLCLQNTIPHVGKAKIKADINPLTIPPLPPSASSSVYELLSCL